MRYLNFVKRKKGALFLSCECPYTAHHLWGVSCNTGSALCLYISLHISQGDEFMQRSLSFTLITAATLSLLAACGPAPTQNVDPSASPSAEPTTVPSATPSAVASPSSAPSAKPSATPTAEATPAPTANPGASATPTPLPSATSDISVIETTTFNGKVYDDTNAPLDGVTIKARSLNSSVPFEVTTTTAGGTYSFNNAPSGVQIEIVASRSGFTTRRRIEVLKSNKQGDPNANKYDFGTDGSDGSGSAANALSDKPEVVSITPGRNASGIDPKTTFVLNFSEPMDRNSVEDAFSVHVFEDQRLSIHNQDFRPRARFNLTGNTFNQLMGYDFGGGYSDSDSINTASLVWDESDFTATWNADDTQVTFTFADEKLLPTDKDSDKVPDYMATFYAGLSFSVADAGPSEPTGKTLKDKSGILRRDNWFKLTDGNFESYFKFAIKTDEVKPQVTSVIATSSEGGSLRGDSIKVRFSERMLIDTKAGDIGASNNSINGDRNMDPTNPDLYTVQITRGGFNTNGMPAGGPGTWNWGQDLAGTVVFDADDLTRKTVLLLPNSTSQEIFQRSDVIKVTVSSGVVDPAGNTMESRNADKTTTAG